MIRSSLSATFAVVVAVFSLLFASAASASEPLPKLLVVVTSAEPEVQGMAMVLSLQSMKAGAEVRVLLCGPGGDLALEGAPQTQLKPRNVTPQQMMGGLLSQGATVEVCALYLPNSGKTPDDLLEGIGVAKPPAIAATMLAPNTRYFTF